MRYLLPLFLALALVPACAGPGGSLEPVKLRYDEVEPPGFFDIGVGFGFVPNTRDGVNDDASGTVVSFKAYPLGRWYSAAQSDPDVEQLDRRDRGDLQTVLASDETERKSKLQAMNAADSGAPADLEFRTAAKRLEGLLESREVGLSPEFTRRLTRALDENASLNEDERESLAEASTAKGYDGKKWRVIEERAGFLNRFSVFYGLSAPQLDGGGIDGSAQVAGIGFDISPDLAVLFGRAFYDVDLGAGTLASDDKNFYGISLNLFAFRDLLANVASAGTSGD